MVRTRISVEERKLRESERLRKRRASNTSPEREQEALRGKQRRLNNSSENRCIHAARERLRRTNNIVQIRAAEALRDTLRRTIKRKRYETLNLARKFDEKPEEFCVGRMEHICTKCGASHFAGERNSRKVFSSCCKHGEVSIKRKHVYPTNLKELLSSGNNDAKNFRDNIRQYNSAFAFASFGYQQAKLTTGLPVVVIHGQVYHKTAATVSPGTNTPVYSSLYILDPDYALQARVENNYNKNCKASTLQQIDTLLRRINPFAHAFKMMKDVIEAVPAHEREAVQLLIVKDRQTDLRRYNLPVANEVAAVFTSADGQPPFDRDICVHPVGDSNALQNIQITSPNCDPMTYPLLFPHGSFGWQPGIPKNTDNGRQTVSMQEFYGFNIQHRPAVFSPVLHAGKLTQQYVIDAFLKIEASRLEWNRQNQKSLRVDLYLGLMDFVNTRAEREYLKPGRICILPSSFTGSHRAMQQNFQDAMSYVCKFGRPDLFITFTCNPSWKEIKESLEPFEKPFERPDIIATVFHLKLMELITDIEKRHVLGRVAAYIYTIEFQKRGLPHCHMLFMLEPESKIHEPHEVDSVVSAELPSEEEDPELFLIVTTSMIHGPCGQHRPDAPCMDKNKQNILCCTKKYPKEFSETTITNVDGYPMYRRVNNGRKVQVRGAEIDNRWVVPYNPYLTRKYNAHINVEICSSVKSVKYIFKYVYKGHDAAVVRMNQQGSDGTLEWDEIQTYIDTRYVSSPEAIWRIRQYNMHDRSHPVERLPVHLPMQHSVVFRIGSEQQALEEAERKGTKLTAWFKLNELDANARIFTYTEIPHHYTWNRQQNKWQKRYRGLTIPRLYAVNPKDAERFAIRLLLLHQKGSVSWEDLRTVNGIQYQTYKEAAFALNLLDDDSVWINTLNEAVEYRMPGEIRILFSTILCFCEPSDAFALYQQFKQPLFEDYEHHHPAEYAEQLGLLDIESNLQQFGKSGKKDFGLPEITISVPVNLPYDINEECNLANQLQAAVADNPEQKYAFDSIMASVDGRSQQKCFFLSGAGGSGKTFVYKALISTLIARGERVKCVAPTGLAATLLKLGQTVHSGFRMPINLTKDSVSSMKQGCKEWKDLCKVKLIIWDEISMSSVLLFEAVDRSLRDLLNCNQPFGGRTIVVGGDFRQQAPVVKRGGRVKVVESCVKSSRLWNRFVKLELTKNMRVNGDLEFCKWLLDVGDGKVGNHKEYVNLPPEICTDDIVTAVYGTDMNNLSREDIATRTILCPTNESTLKLNEQMLENFHGNMRTYFSMDTVQTETTEVGVTYPTEFLNTLTPMGMPPHRLNLKVGCCVMLLRNLNPKNGLCNGTRLIVEHLGANMIECSVFTGQSRGMRVFIPKIKLDTNDPDMPFNLRRQQFPLRLAYSMTITKSQGQTFDTVGLYLPQPVFTHGQLYTALSRVSSRQGLKVKIEPGPRQGQIFEHEEAIYTLNCIYPEIL